MNPIELTNRQKQIIELVKKHEPITSEHIAEQLNMTRAALRPDLTVLTMSGFLEARPKVGYLYSGQSVNNMISDFIKNLKVENIKSSPVIVSEDTTVYDAIVTLFLEDVGTIYIHSGGLLTGVASRKDFLKIALGKTDIHKVPVGIIMTRMPNIAYVKDDDSAYDAAAKIILHEVDSVPVVEQVCAENGKTGYKITGKVSKTNITRLFFDLCNDKLGGL
ncbi:helix-turn-helix transcriptional regulator [Lutispora sp.]|uniref:helix-turn-helix transcriptional regulator n=1 Tax=Lutispora sp. TaxID=2828727 RepID=UPI002B2215CC|nr:helix-turn-helix transcriptional regulator [Lutispora sp.]MEA4960327.1 helix-turn-helix transcriptional regulator [Lutispora sp.]